MQVWETEKGKLLMMSTLIPMIPCARSCALSSNGDLMAAGFDNGDLRVRVNCGLYTCMNICITVLFLI